MTVVSTDEIVHSCSWFITYKVSKAFVTTVFKILFIDFATPGLFENRCWEEFVITTVCRQHIFWKLHNNYWCWLQNTNCWNRRRKGEASNLGYCRTGEVPHHNLNVSFSISFSEFSFLIFKLWSKALLIQLLQRDSRSYRRLRCNKWRFVCKR